MELNTRKAVGVVLAFLFLLTFARPAFAHPSPNDLPNVSRSDLGLALTLVAVVLAATVYLLVGLRRTSRAQTIRDFFFFDKQVSPSQYFDVTVGYSFQVAVTIYFVFWGYKYGIGVFYYAVTWLVGILLFQLCAPRLVSFALSNHTLHSFLADRYGASIGVRRLTAFCTLFGLVGALLIEVNLTTDMFGKLSATPISHFAWISIFSGLLFFSWIYVQYGGYKAAVITDAFQLPISYACVAIVLLYLVWSAFRQGFSAQAFTMAVLAAILWGSIVVARWTACRGSLRSTASTVSIAAALVSAILAPLLFFTYQGVTVGEDVAKATPDLFSPAQVLTQDMLLPIGFLILNLAWQFFDMAAWQRIGSLRLADLPENERVRALKTTIGETKWESPITWGFGILLGIALRYTEVVPIGTDAFDAFFAFTGSLFDNDFPGAFGMVGSYIVLPALFVAFVGITLTTTDSIIATVTFAWVHDIAIVKTEDLLDQQAEQSEVLKRAKRASLVLLLVAGTGFVILHRVLHSDILLLLNVVYSAQFVITFATLGALFLSTPGNYKRTAVWAIVLGLIVNVSTAGYCYFRMRFAPDSQWGDWVYILPTIATAVAAFVVFGVAIGWRAFKHRS